VQGFDWSACGGTHVACAGHVQQIKIVATERRGAELRVTFLCGRRARADYARLKALAQGLVARFTASEDEILDLVDRRAAEADAVRKELAQLEGEWAESKAVALYAEARLVGDHRAVVAALDASGDRVKKVAQVLRGRPGVAVCLAARGARPQIVVTRSDDITLDAGAALRVIAAAGGGKGGGRPDWAQGGVPSNDALEPALEAARAALAETLRAT
jgi:alanyl-tRNA synthetase